MRLPKNLWRNYKKRWLIGGGVVAGVSIIAGAVVWNSNMWQSYEREYTDWYTSVHTETDSVLSLSAKTQAEREKKQASLIALQKHLAEGARHCDSQSFIHWQQFIPVVKQRIDACRVLVKDSDHFGSSLKQVVDYIVSEQKLTKAITTNAATKLDEAGVTQQAQYWSTVIKNLEGQKVSTQFEPVLQLAKTKVATLQQSWQALVAANTAKDRSKYDAAIAQLTTAYEGVREISDLSEKSLLPLIAATEKSYKQAFSD